VSADIWGDHLNAYLVSLEERIEELEARPDYVYNSYAWKFSNAAPPAGAGELRFNNANPALATLIDLRKLDVDGADRTPVLQIITIGAKVRISDWDNAAIIHRFDVTGPSVIGTTNAQIPVVWVSGSGTLPTTGQAKINVAFLVALVV
jgi:hypothetical protein